MRIAVALVQCTSVELLLLSQSLGLTRFCATPLVTSTRAEKKAASMVIGNSIELLSCKTRRVEETVES